MENPKVELRQATKGMRQHQQLVLKPTDVLANLNHIKRQSQGVSYKGSHAPSPIKHKNDQLFHFKVLNHLLSKHRYDRQMVHSHSVQQHHSLPEKNKAPHAVSLPRIKKVDFVPNQKSSFDLMRNKPEVVVPSPPQRIQITRMPGADLNTQSSNAYLPTEFTLDQYLQSVQKKEHQQQETKRLSDPPTPMNQFKGLQGKQIKKQKPAANKDVQFNFIVKGAAPQQFPKIQEVEDDHSKSFKSPLLGKPNEVNDLETVENHTQSLQQIVQDSNLPMLLDNKSIMILRKNSRDQESQVYIEPSDEKSVEYEEHDQDFVKQLSSKHRNLSLIEEGNLRTQKTNESSVEKRDNRSTALVEVRASQDSSYQAPFLENDPYGGTRRVLQTVSHLEKPESSMKTPSSFIQTQFQNTLIKLQSEAQQPLLQNQANLQQSPSETQIIPQGALNARRGSGVKKANQQVQSSLPPVVNQQTSLHREQGPTGIPAEVTSKEGQMLVRDEQALKKQPSNKKRDAQAKKMHQLQLKNMNGIQMKIDIKHSQREPRHQKQLNSYQQPLQREPKKLNQVNPMTSHHRQYSQVPAQQQLKQYRQASEPQKQPMQASEAKTQQTIAVQSDFQEIPDIPVTTGGSQIIGGVHDKHYYSNRNELVQSHLRLHDSNQEEELEFMQPLLSEVEKNIPSMESIHQLETQSAAMLGSASNFGTNNFSYYQHVKQKQLEANFDNSSPDLYSTRMKVFKYQMDVAAGEGSSRKETNKLPTNLKSNSVSPKLQSAMHIKPIQLNQIEILRQFENQSRQKSKQQLPSNGHMQKSTDHQQLGQTSHWESGNFNTIGAEASEGRKKKSKYTSLINVYEKYLKPGSQTIEKVLQHDRKILEKYSKYKFVEEDLDIVSSDRRPPNKKTLQNVLSANLPKSKKLAQATLDEHKFHHRIIGNEPKMLGLPSTRDLLKQVQNYQSQIKLVDSLNQKSLREIDESKFNNKILKKFIAENKQSGSSYQEHPSSRRGSGEDQSVYGQIHKREPSAILGGSNAKPSVGATLNFVSKIGSQRRVSLLRGNSILNIEPGVRNSKQKTASVSAIAGIKQTKKQSLPSIDTPLQLMQKYQRFRVPSTNSPQRKVI